MYLVWIHVAGDLLDPVQRGDGSLCALREGETDDEEMENDEEMEGNNG